MIDVMPAPPIAGVSTSAVAFVGLAGAGAFNTATQVAGFAAYQASFGPPVADSEMGFAVEQFFLNGGAACYIVRVSTLTAQEFTAAAAALGQIPTLNLLAIPGVTDDEVLTAASLYSQTREAILIIDSDPNADTPALLRASLQNYPRSSNIAIYGPWLQVPDPLTAGAKRTIAPSGAIAGMYAENDRSSGVWNAPVGPRARLNAVETPAFSLTDAQSDYLAAMGFNAVRQFPSLGVVVWGARTFAGADSEWKYINVKRFLIYIEQSIIAGTQWVVFEPNAAPLWAEVLESVNAFLLQLFQQGALAGVNAAESFFARCDTTTMTQAEIAGGALNILVGVAPVWPAEFVILNIQQLAGKP
jgi:phage tail sheath protein FI